ncbi:thioesterase domain-containing protein [Streptomyces kronopolitis]|uniref:thioesterase domain-containing protein n=1 Tax=Streptomyces kronopolitis TaxID=1612435 RepID=UPI0035589147
MGHSPLEAHGCGRLYELPPLSTISDLARWLLQEEAGVQALLDVPFGVFGHSLGAITAYEFTRLLIAQRLP